MNPNDPIHKYTWRSTSAQYGHMADRCRKLGISLNAGLCQAVQAWLGLPDTEAVAAPPLKLSEVVLQELAQMEQRLAGRIDALRPPPLDMDLTLGLARAPSQLRADLEKLLQRERGQFFPGTKMRLHHAAQMEKPASMAAPGAHLGDWEQLEQRAVRLQADGCVYLNHEVQSPPANAAHLTIPGALEWNGDGHKPLTGQNWCIDGRPGSHPDVRQILTNLGATITPLNKRATDLLQLEEGGGQAFADHAAIYGTRVWTERKFLHLVKGLGVDVELPT